MDPARLYKLHQAVDRQSAETVSVTPMQAGGYLAGSPTGAPTAVSAYVAETSTSVRTSGNAANSGHNTELIGATHTAKFTTSGLPFAVSAGFIVTRYDCDDPATRVATATLRVTAVLSFGTDRTVLLLVKVTA